MNKIRRKKADAIELDECDKPIIKGWIVNTLLDNFYKDNCNL